MRSRKKAIATPSVVRPVKLERAECDFSGCPKTELFDCWRYEIARESESIKNVVQTLQEDTLTNVARKTGYSFFLFSDWPKVPYLSIQHQQRRAIIKLARPSDQEMEAALLVPQMDPKGIEVLLHELRDSLEKGERPRVSHSSERLEFALLRIDWVFPDTLLLQFLKSYLKQYRPAVVRLHERTGKEAPDSKHFYHLQQLGMYRVLRANDWKVTRAIEAGHFNLSKSNRKAWSKARKAVENAISDFTSEFLRKL